MTALRVASFLINGANGQTAEVSAIPLSGQAGADLANINRWRGQIQLIPITQAELARFMKRIQPHDRDMWLVDFPSEKTLLNNPFRIRLIAAVYKEEGRTWFFKMTGEDETVQAAYPAFLEFLSSLRFHGDH